MSGSWICKEDSLHLLYLRSERKLSAHNYTSVAQSSQSGPQPVSWSNTKLWAESITQNPPNHLESQTAKPHFSQCWQVLLLLPRLFLVTMRADKESKWHFPSWHQPNRPVHASDSAVACCFFFWRCSECDPYLYVSETPLRYVARATLLWGMWSWTCICY